MSVETFFLLVILAVTVGAIVRAMIVTRLQKYHTSIWRELDAPQADDFRSRSAWRVVKYLWKGEWWRSGDPLLVTLAVADFAATAATVVLLIFQVAYLDY